MAIPGNMNLVMMYEHVPHVKITMDTYSSCPAFAHLFSLFSGSLNDRERDRRLAIVFLSSSPRRLALNNNFRVNQFHYFSYCILRVLRPLEYAMKKCNKTSRASP